MSKKTTRNSMRIKRHKRARRNLIGTAVRPRLSVYRSNKNIFAQLIDDINGETLASASTLEEGSVKETRGNKEGAKAVGEVLAKRALEKDIKKVVFDRSGYRFHGRIKALADAAREAGLEF